MMKYNLDEMQWCKLSTNDRHILREVGIVLDAMEIENHMAKDDINRPPTMFAWCEKKTFYTIIDRFGIHH